MRRPRLPAGRRASRAAPIVLLLIAGSLAGQPDGTGSSPPEDAVVPVRTVSGDAFLTDRGLQVVLEGVQAPRVDPDGTPASRGGRRARRRLQELLVGGTGTRVGLEHPRTLEEGHLAAWVRLGDGRLVQEVLLREGLVQPAFESEALQHVTSLEAAHLVARRAGNGLQGGSRPEIPPPLPFHKGVSMGLYSRDADYDYRPFLDAAREVGATHVLFVVPYFMEDWQDSGIRPVEERTAPLSTARRVALQARERGLRAGFMPIVLLLEGRKEHWRGDIEPARPAAWWRAYARLLGRWADLAAGTGATMLVVGSELTSLEDRERRWRTLIHSLRLRFDGRLTYSANWDHYRSVPFWDALDVVGMTGYHSLTDEKDPEPGDLLRSWKRIRRRLLEFQGKVGKPLLFTELGYASQDGINTDPWNYFMSDKPAPREQADCFQAFIDAWDDPPRVFAGAYFYDWWRNGDDKDRTNYSILGKPAEQVIRRYFRQERR